MLHTSGTTSRPKIVPLTQANICLSALTIKDSLKLTHTDRCLNIMPLFHVHGLIGALLSTLTAGGTIYCTPGIRIPDFFDWMDECKPTWYTAVPSMHQSILAAAPNHRDTIERNPLRFIRSCSSALPPQVMAELETTFDAPTVEAYGMTEASHQMTCNPLPPLERKPGSVGIGTGSDVSIMDEIGALEPSGVTGEIVIRGPSVTHGYENNPAANQDAFTKGWFRTGDEGYLDDEGYLFITGRIKEIINRAGEKISPREVDEILLDHPAVAQAVTFALPHPHLGEEVGAAVTLREGLTATPEELMAFAAVHLADHKVPKRVLLMDEIPKGPTGKLQRVGLAEKLGLTMAIDDDGRDGREMTAPRTSVEKTLRDIWVQVLGHQAVGIHDSFFDLGGHSLSGARLFADIEKTFDKKLPLSTLFQAPTIAQLAALIEQDATSVSESAVITLKPGDDTLPPLFLMTGVTGDVLGFRALAQHLSTDHPLYSIEPRGLQGDQLPDSRVEDMATRNVKLIQSVQARGPYLLGGLSFGGYVACEIARQLRTEGHEVPLLVLLDTPAPLHMQKTWIQSRIHRLWEWIAFHRSSIKAVGLKSLVPYAKDRLGYLLVRTNLSSDHARQRLINVLDSNTAASRQYEPQTYAGSIVLLRAKKQPPGSDHSNSRTLGWDRYVSGGISVHDVPGTHYSMTREPHIQELAQVLGDLLQDVHSNRTPAVESR